MTDSNDLRCQDLSDLRCQDLSDRVLFGHDLSGTKLYGAKISLRCETFDGLKLDDTQLAMLLLMISQVSMPTTAWRDGLRQLVRDEIGDDAFRTLERYLQLA